MERPTLPPQLSFHCPKDWGEMKGDDRRRFCDGCQLHVHNLSEISRRAGERLLSDRGAHCCVIYRTSAGGTLLTASRWTRFRRSSRHALRALAALFAVAFPILVGSRLQADPPEPKDGGTAQAGKPAPRPTSPEPQYTMGMVAPSRATPAPSPSPVQRPPIMGRVAPRPQK